MLSKYFSFLYRKTAKDSSDSLRSCLERNPNAMILDCGCWDGKSSLEYGKLIETGQVHGIEVFKEKAREARKAGVKVEVSDLNKKFPYPDGYFDAVIANHVIEHLVNVRLFASEIRRVLKKDGYVVIGTPNLASWHNVFALLIGVQPFSGPTIKPDYESDVKMVREMNKSRQKKVFKVQTDALDHIKIMTLRALVGLLKDSGLKIEFKKGFGYYPLPPPLSSFFSWIDSRHSHYVVVKARK
jgi:SAM-dependent methyltransferase